MRKSITEHRRGSQAVYRLGELLIVDTTGMKPGSASALMRDIIRYMRVIK